MNDVLVVVDMQNDFIDGALGTLEAQAIVEPVVKKIRNFQGEILFTRDVHGKDYLQTQEGKKLPVEHCLQGTVGCALCSEILGLCNYVNGRIFDKSTFGSVELAEHLKKLHEIYPLDSITFVGLCTDICVISNVLLVKSYLPEVPIIVDSQCCAGVTPESHENALKTMKMCQIEIL
ncbi:MAG: isochorismatase family cysteine hydrolase [Bacillota bacterium]|nr:isochorismatase family cysteine hydrolase [Bacillota bacterium]